MTEFRSIDIDFDVHKRIELARESFSEVPNTTLRRLLSMDPFRPIQKLGGTVATRAWSGKGVMLPHGTRIRMDYNGRTHEGEISDGAWSVEGERYNSPSAAAGGAALTKGGNRTNLDGWIYWWVLIPNEHAWVKLSDMRKAELSIFAAIETKTEKELKMKPAPILKVDLPPESEVMVALETYLAKRKRTVSPSEAYHALAEEFKLTNEQRARLMPNGKDCHWENRVRFARRKLVDAGIMVSVPRGQWSLAKRFD
jgi:hypothetical protein